jgi:hypothetical protein
MTVSLEKEREKAPSKELKEKVHECISSFQKLGAAVNEALEQGRKEGFTDKEIGKMIRDEMLQAGFERSTIAGYLPSSAKQRPRGKPGSRNKISGKNPQTEAVKVPRLDEEQIQESDILAKDDFEELNKSKHEEKYRPVPEAHIADLERVTPSRDDVGLQFAPIGDPREGEYDIEHLERYSRSTLERIVKWQHKHLQEGYNEGISWKSKYMSLKAVYKRATGKEWID